MLTARDRCARLRAVSRNAASSMARRFIAPVRGSVRACSASSRCNSVTRNHISHIAIQAARKAAAASEYTQRVRVGVYGFQRMDVAQVGEDGAIRRHGHLHGGNPCGSARYRLNGPCAYFHNIQAERRK